MKRSIFWLFFGLGAAAPLSVGIGQSDEKSASPTDFVRYVNETNPKREALETAIVRYRNDKTQTTVDLVAVVHFAEKNYYLQLNEQFKTYTAVLYEAVGSAKPRTPNEPEKNPQKPRFPQSAQQQAVQFLGFHHQRRTINYDAKNMIHADVSWTELYDLMEARNQSLTTTARDLARTQPASRANSSAIAGAFTGRLTGGDPIALKRQLARTLADGDRDIARFENGKPTVIIGDRNDVALKKLDTEIARHPAKSQFALFFGAGHMPDFEEKLAKRGFHLDEKHGIKWLTAWHISGTPAAAETEASSAVSEFMKNLHRGTPKSITIPD